MLWKRKRDPYLFKDIETERFILNNCKWLQLLRLTFPWRKDPEMLHALMYERSGYSKLHWVFRTAIPNGRTLFVHAVTLKNKDEVIGIHSMRITRSGTVTMMMSLTDQSWAGKDVFEETRASLMDHFSRSPRVVRFAGHVLARNASSVYNYKKLGYRLIGYERSAWKSPMTMDLMDTFRFEYVAEDWRAERQLELN